MNKYTTLSFMIRRRKRYHKRLQQLPPASTAQPILPKPVYLFPPKQIVFLLLQMLEMAKHLYGHEIVHRNITPDNIFVQSSDRQDHQPDQDEENNRKRRRSALMRQQRRKRDSVQAIERRRNSGAHVKAAEVENGLDIIDVEGWEAVSDDEAETVTKLTSEPSVNENQPTSLEKLEEIDDSTPHVYRLRIGNFSESMQVLQLPYNSR